jgi:poly-gamma-glutamate capsule biosynthesis protein CapA/YwtB (metallophosphatase superfamily)
LALLPVRIRRFQLRQAAAGEAQWLCDLLTREGKRLGTRAAVIADRTIEVQWG